MKNDSRRKCRNMQVGGLFVVGHHRQRERVEFSFGDVPALFGEVFRFSQPYQPVKMPQAHADAETQAR